MCTEVAVVALVIVISIEGQLNNSTSLNSVSALPVTLISSKSRVYLLKDRDPVGVSHKPKP
jgi:hypothetical protein